MPPHAYRQQHSSQHSPRSNNSSHTTGSTSCLPFVPRQQARPLYRPASLRRSSPSPHPPRSSSVTQYNSHAESRSTSPPASPSLAVVEQKQTWLGGLLSPLTDHKEFRFDAIQPSGSPAGSMCSLKSWRPDDDALICADTGCKTRFDVLHRRHHCRRCGDVFCSNHSSRTALLWPHPFDPITAPQTPLATPAVSPRPTPRSSHADLPSLANASALNAYTSPSSSAFSVHSSSSSSIASSIAHTPTSSPPNSSRQSSWPQAQPQQVRVCDACYFAAPTPPMHTPPLTIGPNATIPAFSTRPLTLRHPRTASSAYSAAGPGALEQSALGSRSSSQSPPKPRRRDPSGSRSRSRQDSGMSASSSIFAGAASASASSASGNGESTPPTSVDGSHGRRASAHGKTNLMLPREPRDHINSDDDSDEERLDTEDEVDLDGNHVLTFPAGDTASALSQQAQRRRRRQQQQPDQKSKREVLHDEQRVETSQLLKMDKAFGSVKGAWQSWATF